MTIPADPVRVLLARCARPFVEPQHRAGLAAAAAEITNWIDVIAAAEVHGLTPLVYAHARDGLLPLPLDVHRQLAAQYAMHRHETTVRLRELARVLQVFDADGIPALVLKGPALIALVYTDPGLRPMVDIDILVPPDLVTRAQARLRDLGFSAWLPPSDDWRRYKHHLPPASRRVDDITVLVEIHWDALGPDRGASLGWPSLTDLPQAIEILGTPARALGPHDQLWHLCRHLSGLQHPIRLIWLADIVGVTGRAAQAIDWDAMRSRYPAVMETLSLIDHWTPLAAAVRQHLRRAPRRPPRGVGDDYAGWPRHRREAGGSDPGALHYLARTLAPPEWWLRLNYGRGTTLLAGARLRHWSGLARHAWRRRHAARA